MTTKIYRSISEKISIIKEALAAKENGLPSYLTADRHGINRNMLSLWIRYYKSGKYVEPGTPAAPSDSDMNKMMIEEYERKGKLLEPETVTATPAHETVTAIIFEKNRFKTENSIQVTVEKSELTDIDEFNTEMRKRVLRAIDWDVIGRGFAVG